MRADKHVNLPLKEFLVNKNTQKQHHIENMIDSQNTLITKSTPPALV